MRTSPSLADIVASLESQDVALPDGPARLGFYGNSESMSDLLVSLIRDGRKRATSSLLWAYESDLEPRPGPGDVEIVLNYDGRPAAILSVTKVTVLPFSGISAAFAAAEGEGDLSLDYWRQAHWEFFSSECAQIGRTPTSNMPIVCCEFQLLQVLPNGPA